MTSASLDPRLRDLVLDLIRESPSPLRPTQLLTGLIAKQLTMAQVQDTLAILLDTGVIEMGPDHLLHISQVPA